MNEPVAPSACSSAGVLVRQVESLWAQGHRPDPDALLKAAGIKRSGRARALAEFKEQQAEQAAEAERQVSL
jgi:hypothetical protein